MSNWLGVLEGIVAGAIPAVGLVFTYTANKRAQYDRVLTLIEKAYTPPIADDRHVAGTALEPLSKRSPNQALRLSEAEIKAVFNVLWYFERADAMYLSLSSPLWPERITRVQALLLDSLASALSIWIGYLNLLVAEKEKHKRSKHKVYVDLDDCKALRHLADKHALLQARRARSRSRA